MAHTPGTFYWFECGTTDAAAARDFYTQLFAWGAIDVPMPGDTGGKYTFVAAQDVPNVGRFGVIADPTGAVIAVIKLEGHG